jgi:phage terminase small subunit
MHMSKLTEKQNRFVNEYIIDFDATNAAKRAGYSANSARAIGYENLNKPYIASDIKLRIEKLSEANFISRKLIVSKLLKEALDRSDGSSQSARVNALDKLAKIYGLYSTEPLISITLEKTMADISWENAENRKSLLPKDNIHFDVNDVSINNSLIRK